MTTELSQRAVPGQLATAAPIDSFELLDNVRGGLVAPRKQQPTLATISAGYNPNKGQGLTKAVVSRDGTIYVNGRQDLALAFETVPGLARALQATGKKRLTITFPFDDPRQFMLQRFARYSSSALELYGDHEGLTRVQAVVEQVVNRKTGEVRQVERIEHKFMPADSDEFAMAMDYVKVQTSLYFLLAEWQDNQARVIFPDGVGLYRLRMTSRNSAQNIVNSLKWIGQLTGGRFAGVPFDLFHEQQEVAAPDGKRRSVPVWQLVMKPPKELALTTENFRLVISGALAQGSQLTLPPPRETIDMAALEAPDVDLDSVEPDEREKPAVTAPTQRQIDQHLQGGNCDPARERLTFFRAFGHTGLRDKATRAGVLRTYTNGRSDSLRDFLAGATDVEVRELFHHCQLWADMQTAAAEQAESGSDSSTGDEDPKQEPLEEVEPLTRNRGERRNLTADLQTLLDQAAAVGYEVEELQLAELSNQELAGAIYRLSKDLADYKASIGADLTDEEAQD